MPTSEQLQKEPPALAAVRAHVDSILASLCAEDWGRSPAQIGGVFGPTLALTVAALSRAKMCPVFLVLPGPKAAEDLLLDLEALVPGLPVVEVPQAQYAGANGVVTGAVEWMPVLGALVDMKPNAPGLILCTSVQSLLVPLPHERGLRESRLGLAVGQTFGPRALAEKLESGGYEPVSQIENPGEFSMRGGIFDLWPPSEAQPIRLEYFGDSIETIRQFDPATQRSTVSVKSVGFPVVTVGGPKARSAADHSGGDALPSTGSGKRGKKGSQADGVPSDDLDSGLLNYLPDGTLTAFVDRRETLVRLDGIRPFVKGHTQRSRFEAATEFAHVLPRVEISGDAVGVRRGTRQLGSVPYAPRAGGMDRAAEALRQLLSDGSSVSVHAGSEGEAARLTEALEAHGLAGAVGVAAHEISGSIRLPDAKAAVISGADLLGKHRLRAGIRADEQSAARVPHRAIEDFIRLEPGDYVVHASYGIAKFHRVVEKRDAEGTRGEYLKLEFAGGTEVDIPVDNADAVQKYIGAGGMRPQLSEYRSKSWGEKRARVQEAVLKLAGEMLRIQALRREESGFACPPNDATVHDFVESFPFRDTPDQEKAWAEIEHDLESPRPMDRLICGDVGFGKTELAMRACMKAVLAGKQAAVLVPTTVLAQQHALSFTERFQGHPVTIDMLSRFRSDKQQKDTIRRLKEGRLDIVIGTQRLLSRDVQFHDLGLLVIDEEQRFGVTHKEAIKKLRHTVDVLTLSATPIPRTLHMALLGIRDISSLTTPPEHRHPVETILTPWNDHVLREALNNELAREGQIFVVHNRINDIETIAGRIRSLVPDARIAVGHGQMAEGELEKVMLRFIRHEVDILVSTTIIESGIDVQRANTMFIDQAQNYGLADLHQLRGRVGRYRHHAYCYLIVPGENRIVSEVATKRLRAIVEHHTLGSGFHIAMRDLELRGAGNIIGNEQSGFIASVGYDLYCQMLERAVKMLRGEKVVTEVDTKLGLKVDTVLPAKWVKDPTLRVEVYRKLGRVRTLKHADWVRQELTDRFGKLPREAESMLMASLVRHRLGRLGVTSVAVGNFTSDLPGHFRFACINPQTTCDLLRKGAPGFRVLDGNTVVLPMHRGLDHPLDQLKYLYNLLQAMVSRGHLDEQDETAVAEAGAA